MKIIRTLLLISLLSISGCVTPFDPVEYDKFVTINALADRGECSKETVEKMLETSRYLFYYTVHKPNDQAISESAFEVFQSIQEINTRMIQGKISPVYCQLKMDGIALLSGTFAEVIGRKK